MTDRDCIFCLGSNDEKTAAYIDIDVATADRLRDEGGPSFDISVDGAPLCLAHADQLYEGLVDYEY
jgi:hypothetical protein